MSLTGCDLYERARDIGGANFDALDDDEAGGTLLRRVKAGTIREDDLVMNSDIVRRVFGVRPGIDGKQLKLDFGDRWQPYEAEEGIWLVVADDQLTVHSRVEQRGGDERPSQQQLDDLQHAYEEALGRANRAEPALDEIMRDWAGSGPAEIACRARAPFPAKPSLEGGEW